MADENLSPAELKEKGYKIIVPDALWVLTNKNDLSEIKEETEIAFRCDGCRKIMTVPRFNLHDSVYELRCSVCNQKQVFTRNKMPNLNQSSATRWV